MQPSVMAETVGSIGNPTIADITEGSPEIQDRLLKPQKDDLKQIVSEFQEVFNKEPGESKGVMHQIKTPPGCIMRNPWR